MGRMGRTGRVARIVPTLLLHVNLLLTLFAGAMLTTAARLKWDPSAYVAARELFPLEYRSAAAALPALGAALALLGHLALSALRCGQYGALMLVLVWCELAWGTWLACRVRRWLRGGQAQELRHALALSDHLHPLLQHLAHYHPLPERVNQLMEEAEADLPRNVQVAAWAGGALVALQLAAAALALCSGRAPRRQPLAHSTATTITPLSSRRRDSESAPLRAVYKNGRLVVV